jgi:hypothetical protein
MVHKNHDTISFDPSNQGLKKKPKNPVRRPILCGWLFAGSICETPRFFENFQNLEVLWFLKEFNN